MLCVRCQCEKQHWEMSWNGIKGCIRQPCKECKKKYNLQLQGNGRLNAHRRVLRKAFRFGRNHPK